MDTILTADPVTCLSPVFVPQPTQVADNCLNTFVSRSFPATASPDQFPAGVFNYTLTVTDSPAVGANSASCSFQVTVRDTQAPSLACPASFSVARDPVTCDSVLQYNITPAIDCTPANQISYSVTGPMSGTTISADTTVTIFATDSSSNTASCSFTVTLTGACTGGTTTSAPTTPETSTTTATTMATTTTTMATTSAPVRCALLFGVSATSTSASMVRMAFDGSTWTTATLGMISHVNLTITSISPNGLAYDSASGLIFLASFGQGRPSVLFSYNITSGIVQQSGGLTGQAGSGAMRNGAFWYVDQRSDRLRRAAIDPVSLQVVSDVNVANLTNGTKAFDFGDIDFGLDGKLYWTARVQNGATTLSREFSSYDLTTGVYTLIATQGPNDNYNQLALGANGVWYNSNNGQLMTMFNNGTLGGSLLASTITVTDLASAPCFITAPASTSTTIATTSSSTTVTTTTITTVSSTSTSTSTSTSSSLPTSTTTVTTVGTTRAPAFPCLAVNNVLLFGVSATSTSASMVRMAFDGSTWTTATLGMISHVNLTITSSSPNGLAYDSASGLIFLASFGGGRPSVLFSYNITSGVVQQSGGLIGQAGSGAMRNGAFWYVDQRSDRLRRAAIDPVSLQVVSDVNVANLTNGTKAFDFGDIDFGLDGKLYWTAKVQNGATTLSREFSSYDLTTGVYTLIATQGPNDNYNQLALGANGVWYNSNNGQLTSLFNNGTLGASLLPATVTVTDLTSVLCSTTPTVAPTTSTSTVTTTVTTTATSTVTSTSTTTIAAASTASSTSGTTVTTTTMPLTTRAPAFPCTVSNNALLYGVTATSTSASMVRMSFDGSTWTTATLGMISHVNLTVTSSSPNGLSYDSATGLIFLASFGGGRPSVLFSYNITSGVVRQSGGLVGQAGSGAMFGGYFWYVDQRSDRLQRVTLDPISLQVVQDINFANLTNGAKAFDFGDIEFGLDGKLYWAAKVQNGATTLSREFSSYDLTTKVYTLIATQGPNDNFNQLALGANGVWYNSNNGQLRVVMSNGTLGSSLLSSTVTVTDLASVACIGLDLNGDTFGARNTIRYTSGGQPSLLVSSAYVTGVSLQQSVTSFTATLRLARDGTSEMLSGVGTTAITLSYNSAQQVLTATGAAPVTDYIGVLNSLSYFDTADPATAGTRYVDISLTLSSGTVVAMSVPVVVA